MKLNDFIVPVISVLIALTIYGMFIKKMVEKSTLEELEELEEAGII